MPLTANAFPQPADAVRIEEWVIDPGGPDSAYRCFTGSSWVVGQPEREHDTTVVIVGTQHADRSTERGILVERLDDELTIGQARELARALMAAADEAADMNGRDEL
ncbi:hypothetical protein [Mycobacterium sp. E1747]|uniref:hypothetical protein n=1 Tax=Mycobacterium sp. E1747 TaxID=1834128 RepID=UPI0007FD4099|nr:hypothetical protein [Mycobacterium sp. E1747]OBH12090.1 hypothetical protein A5695_17835 [Mycobacterium sp. E1747]